MLLAAADLAEPIRAEVFQEAVERILDRPSGVGEYIPPHVTAKVLYAGAK